MKFAQISDTLRAEMLKCNEKFANRDYTGAYQGYLNLLIDNPGHPALLHNLGTLCFQIKKYTEGIGYFVDALDNNPDDFKGNSMAYFNAAHCCVCAGNMIKAHEYIIKAFEYDSQNDNINKLYAKILKCYTPTID